ncbi:MAG TPA: hypothetical protein VLT13_02565 [Bacteroidota bacterium]|nr:hypothetical protein [Bacteroidota bacterium]
MDIILILIGIGILVILVWIVATGGLKSNGPGGAALTSMHDFSPRDKQEAIEIIMEQKAGKRWEEQHSGDGEDEDGRTVGMRDGRTRDRAEVNERPHNERLQNKRLQNQREQNEREPQNEPQ